MRQYSTSTWPDISSLSAELRKYVVVANELTVTQDILLRGSRIVVPVKLQEDTLYHLHERHQGINRCRTRASMSVWWPNISQQIAKFVTNCPTCSKYRCTGTEPLMSTPLPDRPWQVVGTDLLEENKRHYIVVVDYFSRFFELEQLTSTTSEAVIQKLQAMFARHGIPEIVRSDNGPQYSSAEFSSFAENYGFTHVTSSPHYPQSNGEAERAVQTA